MIPLFKVHVPPNIGKKIQEVFDSGFITEGEYSDKFEKILATNYFKNNTSLTNSGTSALTLAYRLSSVSYDTEVITTPMTCMATNEPLHTLGAKIVWSDIDPETGNIDPKSIAKKITKKTKAIVGVHWAGSPIQVDEIKKIISNSGQEIKLITDAAHAFGSNYKNNPIGTEADFTCFSFQAIKHLTTIDGGAVCSANQNDDEKIKKLRWFGLDRKYQGEKWSQDITDSGYKFHMNNVNAMVGLSQLDYIDDIIKKHQENGKFYDENINNSKVKTLKQNKDSQSSYWIYTIKVKERDKFKKFLNSNGIACDIVHYRNDKYSVFKEFISHDLPGVDEFCNEMINIPVGWWLSNEDRNFIVKIINDYR